LSASFKKNFKKIVEKVLWIGKKALPLQPLSRRGGVDMFYLLM
jgi:hypothetical protein